MISSFTPERQKLLSAIYPIILEKGLKSTTMDIIAKRLGMSKRTLYEIFDDKNTLIKDVMAYHGERQRHLITNIIYTAPNVLVALLEIFDLHRREMEIMNVSFFRDMDRLYPELRSNYEERHRNTRRYLQDLFAKGVAQGVFREDINFDVYYRILEIQAESLKRMEQLFPPEITLVEIYDAITTGFLRSIASREGNDLLDIHFKTKSKL